MTQPSENYRVKKTFKALDFQTGEKLKTSSAKVSEVFPSFTGQEGVYLEERDKAEYVIWMEMREQIGNSCIGSDCVGANFSIPVELFLFLLFSGVLFSTCCVHNTEGGVR